MRIAITGATGSLGGALIAQLAADGGRGCGPERVVALSRDEVKSGDLAERWAAFAPLKCMLGDVRDPERLVEVFRGCDVVVHAAALKRIGHSVYSPGEIMKTNVQGTVNVVRAATEAGVGRVVVVSSDKAVEATNMYGMSKAIAECYAVQSNSYSAPRGTRVACVRYGNVLGSRGSVVGVWRGQLDRGEGLTITSPGMTRFIIALPDAARFVLAAAGAMEGGEIFVPLLPAASLPTLADAVTREWAARHPGASHRLDYDVVGPRPGGEKFHEALLSREEPARAWYDAAHSRVAVLPSYHSWRAAWDTSGYATRVERPYTSAAPGRWLAVGELVEMLREVP